MPNTQLFRLEENGDRITVRNVPIFGTHTDRGYQCDEKFLDRVVADFYAQKAESIRRAGGDEAYAMLPPVTVGHTPDDPNVPEPPRVGFMDNVRRGGDQLYADFVDIPKNKWEEIKHAYPYRSCEIIPKRHRLTNVSLLGGRYPHFPLPAWRFGQQGHVERYEADVAGEQTEVLRYTLRGWTMPKNTDTQKHNLPGAGGEGGHPDQAQDLAMLQDPKVLQTIAQAVAKILAEGQANAQGGPMAQDAAAYRGGGKPKRYSDDPKPGVDAGQDTEDEPKKTSDKTAELDTEEKMASMRDELETYKNENAELKEKLATLEGSVGELLKHRGQEQEATKRALLKGKFQKLAALGYAIGNDEKIQRHVNRCMSLSADEVESYLTDLKETAPKVRTAVARYGTADTIERPGSNVDADDIAGSLDKDALSKYKHDAAEIVKLSEME